MFNDPTPEPNEPSSGPRKFLMVSAAVLLVGAIYVGVTFYSRWEANQAIQQRIQGQAAEKERSQNQQAVDAMGGNRFDILQYYPDPAEIRAGEQSSLCYSVSNAKTVKIDPAPDDPIWPAFMRCVHVSPRKTTKYTLTIEDAAGKTKSGEVEVRVR
jgi:hypothetical protein